MANLKKTNRPYSRTGETPLPGRASTSATPPPVGATGGTPEALQAHARELEEKLEASLARAAKVEATVAEARRDQERARQEAQRAVDGAANAEDRALRAEQALADGTAALEKTRMDREVDRARLIEVEEEVALTRRDSAQAIEASQAVVEETRRHAAAVQARLTRAEELLARAADALSELERQEATGTSERIRAIGRAKRILGGDDR
jgi:hypothetical protein